MKLKKKSNLHKLENISSTPVGGGGGGTPCNGPYWDALPERGTFVRFEVYERVEISLVKV